MSSFEWNKIIGAVLVALLAIKTFDIVGNAAVAPHKLEQNAYIVEGVEAAATATADFLIPSAKTSAPSAVARSTRSCRLPSAVGSSATARSGSDSRRRSSRISGSASRSAAGVATTDAR